MDYFGDNNKKTYWVTEIIQSLLCGLEVGEQ